MINSEKIHSYADLSITLNKNACEWAIFAAVSGR